MKLNLASLTPYLKKQGMTGHYLLQGDDPYLQQQAQATYLQVIDDTTEVLRFSTSHAAIWDEIDLRLRNRSLFAPTQLVFIDIAGLKLPAPAQAYLKQWLNTVKPSFTLVLSVNKLTAKDKQIAWLKAALALVHEVTLAPPTSQQMPTWLKQGLAQRQLTTDTAGLNLLTHYFADNPGAALQEIEKIADYLGDRKHIASDELEQILVSQGQYTVFQLIDACLAGKVEPMLIMFDNLMTDESLIILITWNLAKELRLLISLRMAIAAGQTMAMLAKQHRLWPAKVELYQRMLKHYQPLQLWALLNTLAMVDKASKGSGSLSARTLLQQVLHRIAIRLGGFV